MLNAFTIDVEEHFQVSAFEGVVRREDWDSFPSRVCANTNRLLDVLAEHNVRATFFVLGWVGERYPELVRAIADGGHEIASHGYSHRLVHAQSPAEFRRELERSRKILQDASGQSVDGHRAASFSIGASNLWALDVVGEVGFSYDSSLFPVWHDRYGIPGAPRGPFRLKTAGGGELIEIPPSTLRLCRMTIPVAGGGYLRLFPEWVTHRAIRRLNSSEGFPAVVYLHPWELDPEQPRIRGLPARSRLRHYINLGSTHRRVRALLQNFEFGPMLDVIDALGVIDEQQVS